VVAEITAFGRPAELHRAPTAIHTLLDECLTFGRARCETEGLQIERDYDTRCPEGELDARELRKAFLNLILNGLESLEPGGCLRVTTACAAEPHEVRITFEDNGSGMNEETLSRVFDLFFTTKPEGTGLGMAIARSVIDLHGGQLTLQSEPGRGTRAVVRLPLTSPRGGPEA
jgi:signal transduction histidine kinase